MNTEYIAAEEFARQTEKTFNTRGNHSDKSREEIYGKGTYDEMDAIEGIDTKRKIDHFEIDLQSEETNVTIGDTSGNNTYIEHDGRGDFTILQNKAVTTQQTESSINVQQQQFHANESRNIGIQLANSSIMTGLKFNVETLQPIHHNQRNEKVMSSEHKMNSKAAKLHNHSKFVNGTAVHETILDIENGIQSIPKFSSEHEEHGADSEVATGDANGTAFNYAKNYYSNNETSRHISPSGNKTTIHQETEQRRLRGFAIHTSR